jgi:cobalt ECF transporter T component CbiQ
MSVGVIGKTVRGFSEALGQTLEGERCARQRGLLQALDPRVKLVGLLALVVAAALSRRLAVMGALFALGIVLALASRLSLLGLAKRVWVVAFGFTFMIAAPALFLTPGDAVYRLGGLAITAQGLRAAVVLVARVETAVTLSTLLVLTTPWMHLLKALRTLLVPVEVIMLLAMTHRYVVLLTETANAMFEARQSRVVGRLKGDEQRRLMVNSGGVLLSKTLEMGDQVHMAMLARGFRGEVRLLHEFRLKGWDYVAISGFAVVVVAAAMAGR